MTPQAIVGKMNFTFALHRYTLIYIFQNLMGLVLALLWQANPQYAV